MSLVDDYGSWASYLARPMGAGWNDFLADIDAIETALDLYLPLTAGITKPLTGHLYVSTAVDPSIFLNENGNYDTWFGITDYGDGRARLMENSDTGVDAIIDIECQPGGGSDQALVRFFKGNTNTSGTVGVLVYEGDGSSDINHSMYGGSGDANFCQQGGSLKQAGTAVSLSGHDHDSSYYTEGEIDTMLAGYLPLSAGSGNRITGDLYFNNNTALQFRNAGDTDDEAILQASSTDVYFGTNTSGYTSWVRGPTVRMYCDALYLYGILTGSGAPDTSDFINGTWGMYRDTSGGHTYLCANYSNTLYTVELT